MCDIISNHIISSTSLEKAKCWKTSALSSTVSLYIITAQEKIRVYKGFGGESPGGAILYTL